MALGASADTVEIPDTTPAGEGIPSFTSLFPILTQIDPTAGGVFIQRTWMNGLFQMLGNNIWYLQHGCLFPWNATFDYPVGAHVLGSDNQEYVALQESTGQDPTTDTTQTYWEPGITATSVFTAPTASEPGKAGLVPGPEATPDGTLTILTSSAEWKAFAEQFAALGADGTITETVKSITSGSVNTVTEPGTYNVSISGVADLPTALSGGSIMKVYGPATNNGAAFRADTLQILYAETSSGVQIWAHFALSPNTWTDWIRIDGLGNAPRPQAAEGVGIWKGISGVTGRSSITLPAGGVWAHYLVGVTAAGALYETYTGVRPGGSIINSTTTNISISGLAWRIA